MSRVWTRRSIEEIFRHILKEEGGGGSMTQSDVAAAFFGASFAPTMFNYRYGSTNTYAQLTFVDFDEATQKATWALTLIKEDMTALNASQYIADAMFGQAGNARDPWCSHFNDEVFLRFGHNTNTYGLNLKPGSYPPVQYPVDMSGSDRSPFWFLSPPTPQAILAATGFETETAWDKVWIGASGVAADPSNYPIRTQSGSSSASQLITFQSFDYYMQARMIRFRAGQSWTNMADWFRAIKFIELT